MLPRTVVSLKKRRVGGTGDFEGEKEASHNKYCLRGGGGPVILKEGTDFISGLQLINDSNACFVNAVIQLIRKQT